MKHVPALTVLTLAAGLAACGPAPVVSPSSSQTQPVQVDTSVETNSYEASEPAEIPVETGPWTLTSFTPATNEIYCSFYNIGADGRRGERVFITEIAGVPAPAHVGLEGEDVALTQVSKEDNKAPQVWIYENAGRSLQLEMQVTETAKGFESRDYEGTAQVTRPEPGPLTAVAGTCGV